MCLPLRPPLQVIVMWLNCDSIARRMGKRHNERSGIGPRRWLEEFACAVNRGSGLRLRNQPLPLYCYTSPGDSAMHVYMVCVGWRSFINTPTYAYMLRSFRRNSV